MPEVSGALGFRRKLFGNFSFKTSAHGFFLIYMTQKKHGSFPLIGIATSYMPRNSRAVFRKPCCWSNAIQTIRPMRDIIVGGSPTFPKGLSSLLSQGKRGGAQSKPSLKHSV